MVATRLQRSVVACAAVLSLVAGCGGGSEEAGGGSSSPEPPPKQPQPFTGQLVEEVPDRGALVVKVDNTDSARPQRGLGTADLVVEELVEGGLTRLAVFYHSKLPDVAGPVRSLRTSDVGIVAPTRGLLAASGGARVTTRAVAEAGVRTKTPPGAAFSRDGQRQAPYDLMLRPTALDKPLADFDKPTDYLQWAPPNSPAPAGRRVGSAEMEFSPMHTTRWTYDAGRGYSRRGDLAAKNDRFPATTVLVLRVRTRDAGYRDPAGNPVPETVLTGGGEALLLHGGRAIRARWSKPTEEEPLSLTSASGGALRVPAGRTWIELVPRDGKVTTAP